MKKIILIFFMIALSVSYSAILKWESDCTRELGIGEALEAEEHPMLCYHSVAMSYALVGNKESAIDYCNVIKATGTAGDDVILIEGQANRCFRDIAKILWEDSEALQICDQISTDSFLYGHEKEICKAEVIAERNRATGCTIVYIFPMVVLGSFAHSVLRPKGKTP